jgi:pyrimidine operon attenuation protein/uracil phosphoribosyltransferase
MKVDVNKMAIDIDVFRKDYRYEALLHFHQERTKKKRILNRDILLFFFHIYTISAKKLFLPARRYIPD